MQHRVDDVLVALADPTRRDLLDRLARTGPTTATRLAETTPITRQAVRKHLTTLQRAGLVRCHRAGREARFRVDAAPLQQAIDYLGTLARRWDERLAALKALAEEDD